MPSRIVRLEIRVGKGCLKGRDRGGDLIVEAQPRDGHLASAGELAKSDRDRRRLRVEHRTPAHFVPVVILGVDPEHRHDGHAVVAAHRRGEFHGGDRFEQREQRSAEEPGLLAGDDDNGPRIGEPCGGGSRCRWRPAPLLLSGEHARDLGRRTGVGVAARDRLSPGLAFRGVAGEVRPHAIEREGVVGGQASNPGEAANVDGQRRRRWTGCGV